MADQHFCQNCHRNFNRSLPQRCPHCDSSDIVETRGACHVPGCPYPKLDDAETCRGHADHSDGVDS